MARLSHFGQAMPVLRYFNWAIAALVTLFATYLHVPFLLNAGGLWRDEVDLVHLSLLPSFSEVWKNLPHDSCPILMRSHRGDLDRISNKPFANPERCSPWGARTKSKLRSTIEKPYFARCGFAGESCSTRKLRGRGAGIDGIGLLSRSRCS